MDTTQAEQYAKILQLLDETIYKFYKSLETEVEQK